MIIYSLSTCAPCRTLKYFLDKKHISYEEKDLNDPEVYKESQQYTKEINPPIVLVKDQVLVNPPISKVLELVA